jgi:hypothetical protein
MNLILLFDTKPVCIPPLRTYFGHTSSKILFVPKEFNTYSLKHLYTDKHGSKNIIADLNSLMLFASRGTRKRLWYECIALEFAALL